MSAVGGALHVVRDFRRPYVAINVGYYGLILAAMLAVAAYRPLQQPLHAAMQHEVRQGTLSPIRDIYTSKHFLAAVAVTFLVNLLAGSLLYINLPSLIVPFSGLLLGAVRAIMWGLLFAPRPRSIGRQRLRLALSSQS